MTYRYDCGGQKFFRNELATCGETAPRDCKCGGLQSSHRTLLRVFGAGTPITPPPTIAMLSPVAGDGALGSAAEIAAGAQRGVARVELVVNGFAWATVPGAKFLAEGQPDPSHYRVDVPAELPDGIIDVSAVAYDDLDISTASNIVTLTKGAPCADAATCATGQRCDAGRCLWDPPVGEVGDACTYPQFCKSLRCEGAVGAQVCSQTCEVSGDEVCTAGQICQPLTAGSETGVCVTGAAGCCSTSHGSGGGLAAGLAAVVFGAVRRRRRSSSC